MPGSPTSGAEPFRELETAVRGLADEGLARWVAEVRRAPSPSCRMLGASALREAARARSAARPPGPALPLVEPRWTDAGLPLRLYRPDREPRPLVLYLHGGGFVMGDLDSHDSICRRLAQIADVVVLAVDCRRAPEHPGPAAVDDAVSGFGWAMTHLDELGADPAAGIALAGDSSGGALAEGLRDAGVEVHHVPLAGLVHGFIGLGQVSPAAALATHTVFDQFGALVRKAPHPS